MLALKMLANFLVASAMPLPPALHDPHVTCPTKSVSSLLVDKKDIFKARFVIVGEKHGTEQTPQFFLDLVCHALQSKSVNIFLEFEASANTRLQSFIASRSLSDAADRFVSDDIWDPQYADGRSSRAMFKLLEKLRSLKISGAKIEVFASQPDFQTLRPQWYSELARANLWASIAAKNPADINLILVGTAHAALIDNDSYGFQSAAAHLRGADVVSLGPAPEGGAHWSLELGSDGKPDMGIHTMPGSPHRRGVFESDRAVTGWDMIYAFGEMSRPSMPARQVSAP